MTNLLALTLSKVAPEDVGAWAELIEKYGWAAVGTIVGFMVIIGAAAYMFARKYKDSNRADKRREEREDLDISERQEMTDKVIELVVSCTKAIEASTQSVELATKEMAEFRRETATSFRELIQLILDKSKESSAAHDLIKSQLVEQSIRLAKIEVTCGPISGGIRKRVANKGNGSD